MTACKPWTGAKNSKGYGSATRNGRGVLAHRMVWEDANGPIPDGHHLHHTCGRRDCVELSHLQVVTPLRHNREHAPGEANGDRVEALLAKWGPMRGTWAAHWLGLPTQQTLVTLSRAVKAGTVKKIARGVYGPLTPAECPYCSEPWENPEQWCRWCGEPKWELLALRVPFTASAHQPLSGGNGVNRRGITFTRAGYE